MQEIEEQLVVYIKDINSKPLLTFEEEKELSKTIQARLAVHSKIKDEEDRKKAEKADEVLGKAIEKLTTHNLRLVIKEAFHFQKATGVNIKDLIGSGNLGLVKATYLYDSESYKTRFSTYATYWIRQVMFETIHANGIVKVPVHILNGRYRHDKLIEDGIVNDEDIMKAMEIDENQLERIKKSNVSVISMDQEVGNHGTNGDNPVTVGEIIPDENAEDPSEGAVANDHYRYLYEAMGELDEMSKDIVSSQILADDKVQLRELGKKYGKTGERIRQIKEQALKTLRKKVEFKMKHGSISER